MTAQRLGVTAFAVLGVHMIATSLAWLIDFIPWISTDALYTHWYAAPRILIGFALIRFRNTLSTALFGPDATEVSGASVWDVQVSGLAILGVYLIASHVPDLALSLSWISDPPRGTFIPLRIRDNAMGEFWRAILGIVLGVALVIKGRVVARAWCKAPDTEGAS